MARRSSLHTVHCYHCEHAFEVGAVAESTSCPACYERVVVGDIVVKSLMPVKLVQTCGSITVKRRGSLIANGVHAGFGLVVEGNLDADVTCRGPVVIGKAARWKGDCTAPSLSVAGGARIAGGRFAVGEDRSQASGAA